jgi:hypothetical protein
MVKTKLSIFIVGPVPEERVINTCLMLEGCILDPESNALVWEIHTSVINVMLKALYYNRDLDPPAPLRKQLRKINSLLLERGLMPVLKV